MRTEENHFPVVKSKLARSVLQEFTQPFTATQLAWRLGITPERCSSSLMRMSSQGLVRCLNPKAKRSRLFWLTRSGRELQSFQLGESAPAHHIPNVDWQLYGTVCFSHRGEVIRTLSSPMQPSQIKRRAAFLRPGLRMSANNVRDVIQYLRNHELVRPVHIKKRAHPCYELTELGQHFRRLLLKAEVNR